MKPRILLVDDDPLLLAGLTLSVGGIWGTLDAGYELLWWTVDGGGGTDTCVPGAGGTCACDGSIPTLRTTPPRLTDSVQLTPFQ